MIFGAGCGSESSAAVFEGAYEIASLTGNAKKDGEVFCIPCGYSRQLRKNALGGHLSEARISATAAEIFKTVTKAEKESQMDRGWNLMKF